jgi:hypothetical protein
MSSTGAAFGGFYQIMTAHAHLWRTFRVTSSMCPHIDKTAIEADRENLKASVFAIKHDAQFLFDAGEAMISLEHVRGLIEHPPPHVPVQLSVPSPWPKAAKATMYDSRGRERLESKADLRARGIESPDRAVLAAVALHDFPVSQHATDHVFRDLRVVFYLTSILVEQRTGDVCDGSPTVSAQQLAQH